MLIFIWPEDDSKLVFMVLVLEDKIFTSRYFVLSLNLKLGVNLRFS